MKDNAAIAHEQKVKSLDGKGDVLSLHRSDCEGVYLLEVVTLSGEHRRNQRAYYGHYANGL
jgi:hypothetical protein